MADLKARGLPKGWTLAAGHSHSFSYTANGSILTANCINDGCDLSVSSLKLTLTAASQNYSGKPIEPTITFGIQVERAAWTDSGLILPDATENAPFQTNR